MTCFGPALRRVASSPWARVVWVATCGAIVGCESGTGINYGMNSSNVEQHLSYDEHYPFVGFWKLHASDEFGLAIDKGLDGNYRIWSCSPRGSTEVESLSPTTLIDDANFKVVDDDQLEIIDKSGKPQTYVRF